MKENLIGQKFTRDQMEDIRLQDIAYWQSRPAHERIMAGWEHSVMLYDLKNNIFKHQIDETTFS